MKTFIHKNARFTVIENGVLRMEYSKNGKFCDFETLFALRDYANKPDRTKASSREENGAFIIETPLMSITYRENGKAFNRRNLTGKLKCRGRDVFWYPAIKNRENMGGALSTLDGCSGAIPLPEGLISRDGWHMTDDSGTSVIKDGWICERDPNHLSDLYLFVYGNDYKGALANLAEISGKAALPLKCSFGSWYSRWHPYSADDFKQIVCEYEKHDFPLDVLVMDMDWHHHDWQTPKGSPRLTDYGFGHGGGNMGWTGYTWNEKLIPDPEGLIREIKKRGVSVTLNDHPADGIRSNEECYEVFAEKMGLQNGENIPFLCGDRKYMEAFFSSALEPNEKLGVDFWWIDWQQDYVIPTVPGMKKQKVLPWLNYLYFKNSEKNGRRGQIYSRWGGLGDQKHPMFFSGDAASLWETLKFEIEMTVASGNDLCFFWGHDIGGFFAPDAVKDNEMYVRWVQFGIMSAALKLHSCGGEGFDRRPWMWEKQAEDAMREMFHLRSRLFPLIYSAAYKSCRDSVPFCEPLYYEYPECDKAYDNRDEFFIGGLLAAPIYTKGEGKTWYESVVSKRVFLPEGVWYNFFTGERREGEFYERCDIHTFPLYAKAGMPIPMQPYRTPMSSGDLSELIIRLYLPEDGSDESFHLYEDDGMSDKYLMGEYLLTEINCKRQGNTLKLTFEPSGRGFEKMAEMRHITVELFGAKDILSELESKKKGEAWYIKKTASPTEKCEIEFSIK